MGNSLLRTCMQGNVIFTSFVNTLVAECFNNRIMTVIKVQLPEDAETTFND